MRGEFFGLRYPYYLYADIAIIPIKKNAFFNNLTNLKRGDERFDSFTITCRSHPVGGCIGLCQHPANPERGAIRISRRLFHVKRGGKGRFPPDL